MKAHLNRETYRLRVRGRGPRKSKGASKDYITFDDAEWLGVYVIMKPKPEEALVQQRMLEAEAK